LQGKDGEVNLFLNTCDFTKQGAFGFGKTKDRSEASPEKGEKILKVTTAFIHELIDKLENLNIS
jgi:hypothetical protein